MSEQPLPDFDGGEPRGLRRALAGGLSPQAIAALLLIAALLAVLYLLLGGSGDATDTAKNAATPTRSAAAAKVTSRVGGAVATAVPGAGLPTAASASGASGASAAATTLAGSATQALTPAAGGVAGSSSGAAGSVATAATGAVDPTALVSGGFAKVSGTDGDGARLRFGFGLDTLSIRWAEEGETLKILAGPEQGDGYTWYRVQDKLGNVGWMASDFMRATAGGAWAPPSASPVAPPSN